MLYRRKWRFYRRESSEGALLWDGSCVGWWVKMRSCGGVGCRGRSVGMVMCKRGCAAVAAVGGRVQAVCCS